MTANSRIVSVLVPIPVNEPFSYLVPEGADPRPGMRVEVPFGGRREIGYVIAEGGREVDGLRPISAVLDEGPVFSKDLIELTEWMSRYYSTIWYRAIEAAVPVGFKLKKRSAARAKTEAVIVPAYGREEARRRLEASGRVTEIQRTMIEIIGEHPGELTRSRLASLTKSSQAPIGTLIKKGLVRLVRRRIRRNPFDSVEPARTVPPRLTPEQERAVSEGIAAIRAGRDGREGREKSTLLVEGVTGSGKTEVYLALIEHLLGEGGSAIVLVPEISLTPQTAGIFRGRFGETVSILHSALSQGERYDEWRRILEGHSRVVVGARSAVFAPARNLSLIVIDEEHEWSYKQGETPRYHAREVAMRRMAGRGAVVLGSATPSIESYYAAATGKYRRTALPARIEGRPLPPIEIVDMREELAAGNTSIFSRRLRRGLKRTFSRGEQAILFLNRRGYHSFILCRSCGEAVRCPECDITMTYHARAGNLQCHSCARRGDLPSVCPSCGSRKIRHFGAGTERIEKEARRLLPGARFLRMDADTTVRKGAHREIFEAFRDGKADILVGTQMVGKGLDLPDVTLVGVVAAETALHIPDFRAAERTFSLLVQVAGRAGRSEKGGVAIIQTYDPDHPAITAAAGYDLEGFYEAELETRKASNLPPFTRMIQWTVEGPDEDPVAAAAGELASALRREGKAGILGPAPAVITRVRGRYRWQVRALSDGEGFTGAEAFRDAVEGVRLRKGMRIIPDTDAMDLL